MEPTGPANDAADRFAEIVGRSGHGDRERQLIDGAIEIARRGQADSAESSPNRVVDIGADIEGRLDALAVVCPGDPVTPASVMNHLFRGDDALAGNPEDYYDPENSYLNRVLDRRLGIPITLGVAAIEVARRRGVTLVGISMPGHFLLGLAGASETDDARFFDPFNGGTAISIAECRAQFHEIAGPDAPFLDAYLQPVPPVMILGRMLNNLEGIANRRRDPAMGAWVLQFKARFPDAGPEVGHRAAGLFHNSGQYVHAAMELERLAELVEADIAASEAGSGASKKEKAAADLRSKAQRLRARLN